MASRNSLRLAAAFAYTILCKKGLTLASSYIGSSALYSPDRGWEEAADNVQTAGEYWATNAGAGVSQNKLNGLKARLEQAKAKLEQFQADPNNPAPVAGLTKEDLTGDLLYSTVLGYFAANEASQRAEQKTAGAVAYRKSGFGHFGVSANVQSFYGIPRQVSFPGLMMDIDHWKDIAVMKDNDAQRKIAYVRQAGARLSAYEHGVPEKFWTSAQNPGEGVSAVKALAVAAAQGQKIYTLTEQNQFGLAQIQIDDAMRVEIQDAINAGLTVTVHERPITVSGWTGTGYIIEDMATGTGAYKISGGMNGGVLPFIDNNSGPLGLLGMALSLLPVTTGLLPVLVPLLAVTIGLAILAAGLVLYLDSLDGGPCDSAFLSLYVSLEIIFLTAGFIFGSYAGGVFAMWFFGWIADATLRTTHANWPDCRV